MKDKLNSWGIGHIKLGFMLSADDVPSHQEVCGLQKHPLRTQIRRIFMTYRRSVDSVTQNRYRTVAGAD